MDDQLGRRIKSLRQQENLTQFRLAQLLDVSPALISAYELGERKPSLEILIKLANTFKVSVDYLLGMRSGFSGSPDLDGLSCEEAEAVWTLIHLLRSKRENNKETIHQDKE